MADDKNLPNSAGFFWARSSPDMEWWDLIVRVYGEAPFMELDIYDVLRDNLDLAASVDNIDLFGPEIIVPPSAPVRKTK